MAKLIKFAVIGIFALCSLNAMAERDSGFYIGAKTGLVEPDSDSDLGDIDDDSPLALQAGYDFGGFAIQGEWFSTKHKVDAGGFDDEFDLDWISAYGVYRTSGFVYFMAKAGVVHGKVTAVSDDDDDNAFSYGLGGGLNFGDFVSVEAEFTRFEMNFYDNDVDVDMFLVGANIKF